MGNYKYCKSGTGTLIEGIRISKKMILQIGKEDKTQELSEDDIEAIKALPHFQSVLANKKQRERMRAEWLEAKAEAAEERANYRESCKKDLVDYLPVLKKLSNELWIKSVFFDEAPYPEGGLCGTDVNIEKLCKYAGEEALKLLAERLLDCYIEVTGGFDQSNERYYCADAMRDIYGYKDENSREEECIDW